MPEVLGLAQLVGEPLVGLELAVDRGDVAELEMVAEPEPWARTSSSRSPTCRASSSTSVLRSIAAARGLGGRRR